MKRVIAAFIAVFIMLGCFMLILQKVMAPGIITISDRIGGYSMESLDIGYTVTYNGRIAFTMDADNRLLSTFDTEQYHTPQGISFRAVSLKQILVDKMTVLASPKCFRRIKNFIDIYRISFMTGIFIPDIDRLLKENLGFNEFLNRMNDLKHALKKYRTDI